MDQNRMILYPELIYRRYQGEGLVDKAVLKIAMKCYYPEEFEQLIARQGFRVVQHRRVFTTGVEKKLPLGCIVV
jgi:hypothetical protein